MPDHFLFNSLLEFTCSRSVVVITHKWHSASNSITRPFKINDDWFIQSAYNPATLSAQYSQARSFDCSHSTCKKRLCYTLTANHYSCDFAYINGESPNFADQEHKSGKLKYTNKVVMKCFDAMRNYEKK